MNDAEGWVQRAAALQRQRNALVGPPGWGRPRQRPRLHLSDAGALHRPGRPAWTREGSTGPLLHPSGVPEGSNMPSRRATARTHRALAQCQRSTAMPLATLEPTGAPGFEPSRLSMPTAAPLISSTQIGTVRSPGRWARR